MAARRLSLASQSQLGSRDVKFDGQIFGDRIEFSDDHTVATRCAGLTHGVCFVHLEDAFELDAVTKDGRNVIGLARYFEVKIEKMEKRASTFALGVCLSPPTSKQKMHSFDRATALPGRSWIVGYDLPKVFVDGKEYAKVPTSEWRPLKHVKQGDRVGLLILRHRRPRTPSSRFFTIT